MTRNWQRNLWGVWIAELLALMGFNSFQPILPYYVQSLGASGEAVARWTGIVSSAPAVAMAFFGPVWGSLSDRFGRKMMVERAMFGGAIIIILMGFVTSVEQLAALRLLQGALTGTVAAATTLVASTTPQHRLGETLGKLQVAIFLGQSLGPSAGGMVADAFGYRTVFWITSAFLLIAGLIILWVVKEDFPRPQDMGEFRLLGQMRRDFGLIFASAVLALVLFLRFALRLGVQLSAPFAPLLVQELLPDSTQLGTFSGLLATLSGVSSAIAAPVLGRMADRYGGRMILLLCSLLGGVALVLQGIAPNYWLLLLWQIFMGIAIGGTLATLSTYIGKLAPPGRAGTAFGLDSTAVSLANAIGAFAGGLLAEAFSLQTPFIIGGIVMALCSPLVLRLPRQRGPVNNDNGEASGAPA